MYISICNNEIYILYVKTRYPDVTLRVTYNIATLIQYEHIYTNTKHKTHTVNTKWLKFQIRNWHHHSRSQRQLHSHASNEAPEYFIGHTNEQAHTRVPWRQAKTCHFLPLSWVPFFGGVTALNRRRSWVNLSLNNWPILFSKSPSEISI